MFAMETEARSHSGSVPWWRRPYRMLQTNLRQPDALYDQRKLAREVKSFGADVLVYNIGGIFAFYPTELPLHAKNPFMTSDALGAAVEAAHGEGLALVGRFDMSKATRIAYEAHPEWFVHNAKGQPLEYNGTYQACVNGGWYQDYAFRIISEALGRYDVDGVFFNMFGYRTTTYSGDEFGICVCQNCRDRFHAMYGCALPQKEDFSDPAYVDYLEFQDRTVTQLRSRIYEHIKQVRPSVAMSGQRGDCDFIRMEVQRAVDRPQPEWPYQAGEQARWARAYGGKKTASSTSTNFIDFAWRFVSETPAYHLLRFAQQLANGATLDYYLLGVLDQEDKKAFAEISRLYHWHRDHESDYTGLESAARIGLYHSFKTNTHRKRTEGAAQGATAFRGAYRMLVEARLPFDFISDERISGPQGAEILARYNAIVMPSIACVSDEEAELLDDWVRDGGTLIATGENGFYNGRGERRHEPVLHSLPILGSAMMRKDMRGSYFRVADGELPFPDTRLMMLDGAYYFAEPKRDAKTLLTLVPPQRFGPPELCFSEYESDRPGIITASFGQGKVVYLPWHPDALYYRDSLPDMRSMMAELISRNAGPAPVRLEGSGPFELTLQRQASTGRLIAHVINYAGQRNNLYEEPPAIGGLRLGIRGATGEGRALVAGQLLVQESGGPDAEGYFWYTLPPVETFEAILFDGG